MMALKMMTLKILSKKKEFKAINREDNQETLDKSSLNIFGDQVSNFLPLTNA